MDLLEYQGKQLFAKHGIAVPSGEVASTVDEAVAAAERIGYPCAIKAQVLIGGRGKAGGIKIAADRAEAEQHADAILGMDIVGPHGEGPFRVHQVWVEGGSDIASEYYASVILDRSAKKLLAMVSAKGGMDIEAVAAEDPEALVKEHIDPTRPFTAAAARPIIDAAGLDEDVRDAAAEVLAKLAEVASSEDASLIEVNPLIVTAGREVVALDAKVTIDNNAVFRHEDLAAEAEEDDDPQEAMAKEKGLTYVKLDGNVGILANGAGLCMSTLDVVAQAGGRPANFLDAGGGSKAEAIVDALTVITSDEKVTRDPLQHLRRHHPLRRDREGDRHRLGRDRPRGAARRPPRRHQLRGGPGDPLRGRPARTCTRRRRCSTPPAGRRARAEPARCGRGSE